MVWNTIDVTWAAYGMLYEYRDALTSETTAADPPCNSVNGTEEIDVSSRYNLTAFSNLDPGDPLDFRSAKSRFRSGGSDPVDAGVSLNCTVV